MLPNIAERHVTSHYNDFRKGLNNVDTARKSGIVVTPEAERRAEEVRELLDEAMAGIMDGLRGLGLAPDNCDRAFELEATIFAYVEASVAAMVRRGGEPPADVGYVSALGYAHMLESIGNLTSALEADTTRREHNRKHKARRIRISGNR